MPVFFSRFKPDDISGADLFNRSALALRASDAGNHNDDLPQGMRMPGGPRTRFECEGVARCRSWFPHWEQGIDPDCTGEPIRRSALERDADIRIFEAICDVVIRRHEPKWKPSKQEFDFFGSMVRAHRICGGSKK